MNGNTNNILAPGLIDSTYGAVILVAILLVSLLFILLYTLSSIGLMKIAQRYNVKHSWLAWVPFANSYILGKIAFKNTMKAIALAVLHGAWATVSISSWFLMFSSGANLINVIFDFAWMIFGSYALYKVSKQMSNKALIMLIFSVLSGAMLNPIFLFAIRNNPIKIATTEAQF